MADPYSSSPVFDQATLPAALRRDHSTKAGVWGVIRVLEGRLALRFADREEVLTPERPGLVRPEEPHHVEPLSEVMRMQVEFHDAEPDAGTLEARS